MTLSTRQPKARKCQNAECGQEFVPRYRSTEKVCSHACALVVGRADKRIQNLGKKAIEQRERREIKVRREKLKSRADHLKDAEKAVRDYRRTYELSIGSGCISCGKTQAEVQAAQGWKTGGAFDAGHFLGKGARPELRLEPLNIWLQCKACNAGSSKYARKGLTVAQGFRAGLIERIGVEAVEALEADQEPRKHTIEELKAIAVEYRALLREVKKATA
ncbi:recombination protein NinG [Pseudomonas sp. PDM23]|uniref:recombination protein NinG n=1 Tax=Pseudomonas sp. PDM23 TaxID=2769275 RepID=UPI00177D024B|nr:recombination protein NinG [Pseudomonas sp. PDM23]MBD9573754.1 recombination protein NinG [Pseudomonas sp. PDM23]